MLDPAGPSARAIAQVWWWLLGVGSVVLVVMIALWLTAMRPGREQRSPEEAARLTRRFLVGGGVLLPLVPITALLVFGSPAGMHQLPWPRTGAAPLEIDAIGQQWWWELRYPASGVSLRNELRLPVGRPVDIHTQSRDVIHSFWVPRLGGKLDAIPGRTLVLRLQADEPGTFRGQCAEFCGQGHARMVVTVIAMPAQEFDAWLIAQGGAAARGAGQ